MEHQDPFLKRQMEIGDRNRFPRDIHCSSCDSTESLLTLPCTHKFCEICVYNSLQKNLESSKRSSIKCDQCNKAYPAKIFKGIVDEDSYTAYLTRMRNCACISNNACIICGEAHQIGQLCIEYYNQNKHIVLCDKKLSDERHCESQASHFLPCEHRFCRDCIESHIRQSLDKDPVSDIICPNCPRLVPILSLNEVFGDASRFLSIKQAYCENFLSPSYSCSICYVTFKVSEMVTLECDHRFCRSCISGYFESKINISDVHELNCPICNESIDAATVQGNISEETFNRYLNVTLKRYESEDKNLIMKWCKDCDYGALIDKDEDYFECPQCNTQYCPRCNTQHYYKEKCFDKRKSMKAKELRDTVRNDEFLKELMKDLIYCPKCDGAIAKAGGCNFIKCEWPSCSPGTLFCGICRKVLRKEEHYSHYKRSGPFGVTCNTTDQISEKSRKEEKRIEENKIEEVKNKEEVKKEGNFIGRINSSNTSKGAFAEPLGIGRLNQPNPDYFFKPR